MFSQDRVIEASTAMVTSWNKLCFTTGYIEVSISMPGSPRAAGLWPGEANVSWVLYTF